MTSGLTERTPTTVGRRVVVVMPAHDEERFIGSAVIRARAYAWAVVVVDDGSSDATAEIAEAAGAVVIRHDRNRGKGAALRTGFAKARELVPDAVVTMDADGQHVADEIPQVAAPALKGEADIVVGSRYLGPKSDVPRHRVWGHWLFNQLTRQASGVGVSDSQSGFRAFTPRALENLDFLSHGFSVESEMQFVARDRQLRIMEVRISARYPDRPKRPVLSHGMQVLSGLLQLVGQYRPLLFFGVPGLSLELAGFALGVRVLDIYVVTRTLAIGYALAAVGLSIAGMLALTTGIILHSVRGLLLELLGTGSRPR